MPESESTSDVVFGFAYGELRRLARAVRRSRRDATLQTTELLHEAWLKLQPISELEVEDEPHLKRVIARAMRQVLIDGARRRQVRAGHRRDRQAEATVEVAREDRLAAALIDLDRSLDELADMDDRRAAVVECRFFGDMSVDETARALDVSTATVKRDWRVARAWLMQALDA